MHTFLLVLTLEILIVHREGGYSVHVPQYSTLWVRVHYSGW